MTDKEFTRLSWSDIEQLASKLVQMIEKDSYKPDVLVGVSRGGLVPTAILSDRLGIKDVAVIGVRFYRGVKDAGEMPEIICPLSTNLRGKKVLVVDDVADTGRSLQIVKKFIQESGVGEIKVCTLHYKPWSIFKPDYFISQTEAWIVYPWEIKETINDIGKKLRAKGLTELEIKQELMKKGIPRKMIEHM